jgi:hypothetical protein
MAAEPREDVVGIAKAARVRKPRWVDGMIGPRVLHEDAPIVGTLETSSVIENHDAANMWPRLKFTASIIVQKNRVIGVLRSSSNKLLDRVDVG